MTAQQPSLPVKKPGEFIMYIVDRNLVTVARMYRSRWWWIKCTCGNRGRRKDGSCKHEREAFNRLIPEVKRRARIGTPKTIRLD